MEKSLPVKDRNPAITYRDLEVSQAATWFAAEIYRVTRGLGHVSGTMLRDTLCRVADSVPLMIARGQAGRSARESFRAIASARVAIAELDAQLFVSEQAGEIPHAELNMLRQILRYIDCYCSTSCPTREEAGLGDAFGSMLAS